MDAEATTRVKLVEWTKRYLPCELAGWTGELGAGAVAYWLTGSLAVAVIAGTVGSSVGYYATAYGTTVRWSYRALSGGWSRRALTANWRALRSIAIEFGPAEAIDSIVVRPVALYLGPCVCGSVAVGWIVGSIVADLAFYVLAIVSYERFTNLLVRPGAGRERKCGPAGAVPTALFCSANTAPQSVAGLW